MSCESSIADLTMETFEEDCKEQVLSHIKELHEAVVEMKGAFTSAQQQLETVQGEDDALRTEIQATKVHCERKSAEILKLLLTLKTDVGTVKEGLQNTQLVQHSLQSSLHTIMIERDILLDELAKSGAISEKIRGRLHSRFNGFARPSSGSQSTNDSGVALLLERAHAAFQPLQSSLLSSTHRANSGSGHPNFGNMLFSQGSGGGSGDSLSDPHLVSPHVQEYLNNLTPHGHHDVPNDRTPNSEAACFPPFCTTEEVGNGVVYDSDCSLTLAATKSLSLSNSLSKQCGLELDQEDKKNRSRHEDSHVGSGMDKDAVNQTKCGNVQMSYASDAETNASALTFKEGQRLRVAKELLETERKYCNTLQTIRDTFAVPLKNSAILTLRDINTLFPEEVFELYQKHCGLLSQLEERIGGWKNQCMIGDILDRFTDTRGSDVLRLYTNYVNDFPEVLKTFHKLCRSSREFTQFLKSSLEQPACGGLDLGAFLLSPVQRMPRYILLLKQMIKFTDTSHPDYKNISACLDRLRDYLKRLNDSMEHSFQLVTAQITPQPDEDNKPILNLGFANKNAFPRASGSSTHSSTAEDHVTQTHTKTRYKRSTSVPRNHQHNAELSAKEQKSINNGKLKCRSKSDWAVCGKNDSVKGRRCQACNCQDAEVYRQKSYERTLSDSDFNSEAGEDHSLLEDKECDNPGRKFSTSKSLHDFSHEDRVEWFTRQHGCCDNDNCSLEKPMNESCYEESTMKNNIMIRPLTKTQGGTRYVARIQRESESDMNLHLIGGTERVKSKKSSLRNSLKNLFSLKKRYKTGLSESQQDYRVVYSEKVALSPSSKSTKAKATLQAKSSTASTGSLGISPLMQMTTRTLQISGPILPSRPSISHLVTPPPQVAAISYSSNSTENAQTHHSLPPEPIIRRKLSGCDEREARSDACPSVSSSGGGHQPPTRYQRNPAGNKYSNPRLPKTSFMSKYPVIAHRNGLDERKSPYTDV